jgi:ferredoxin-NADP reductase
MSKWQRATLVDSKHLTKKIKSLIFSLHNFKKHKSGQYYDLRLLDHPKAVRSFSTASSPEDDHLEFGIQLLKGGALSPHLFTLKKGEQLELNGPKGEFVWSPKSNEPLLLIAGGSGLVPFMSILRHHYNNFKKRKIILLLSTKSEKDLIYKKELSTMQKKDENLKIVINLTPNESKRINQTVLDKTLSEFEKTPQIYICGSTAFTDNIYNVLLKLGVSSKFIKRERFGPFLY